MNSFSLGFICGILTILGAQFVRKYGRALGHYFRVWRSFGPGTNQELMGVLDADQHSKPGWYSLREVSKELGISDEALVELRARGVIFGYRDGASWKFKADEVERFQRERGAWLDVPYSGSR